MTRTSPLTRTTPLLALAAALLALAAPGTAGAHVRCLTSFMRAHPKVTGIEAVGSATRPAEAGYVDSKIYPLRIHYRRSSDATRAETVVLPQAEDVWQVEIEGMGWLPPPPDYGVGGSDAYDIYLTNEETDGGAYTYTTADSGWEADAYPDDAYFSNSSYIAIDDDRSWIPDDVMPEFLSHEFNHACQYTIDANEWTYFAWESTAEAISVIYIGDPAEYFYEIPSFQSHPSLSLLFDSSSRPVSRYGKETWTYEYGGWIFGAFLEQAIGTNDGTTILQLWEDMAASRRADEPDFVDALGEIGGKTWPDAAELFLAFTEWRMLLADHDDGAHYDDGNSWPNRAKPALEGTIALSSADGTVLTPTELPYSLGNSYWEIDPDVALPTLDLALAGDTETRWGIVAAALHATGPARVVKVRADADGTASARLDLADATTLLVGVANLGAADLDPESAGPRQGTFSLTLATPSGEDTADSGDSSAPPSDSGGSSGSRDSDETDSGSPKEGGGCGCASTGQGTGALGLLVALATLARRG